MLFLSNWTLVIVSFCYRSPVIWVVVHDCIDSLVFFNCLSLVWALPCFTVTVISFHSLFNWLDKLPFHLVPFEFTNLTLGSCSKVLIEWLTDVGALSSSWPIGRIKWYNYTYVTRPALTCRRLNQCHVTLGHVCRPPLFSNEGIYCFSSILLKSLLK